MCSTNLLPYTHVLAHTLENLLTEIILLGMKSSRFSQSNYLFVFQHGTSVVHGCGRFEEWISKTKHSRFICFESVLKCSVIIGIVDAVSAIGMCALE
jgi:hypothetical protein